MSDARGELYDRILFTMIGKGISAESVKDELYIILDQYEIQQRTTEIAMLQQDRNEYLLKKFLMSKMVAGCTKRTIEFYGKELRKMFESMGKTIDDIGADDVRLYMAKQKQRGVTDVTNNNDWRVLNSFYSWAIREEILAKSPMWKVSKAKERKKHKEAFTELEIEQMRNCLRTEREKAMFELLLSTGCRVSELVQIRLDEINGDSILVHGKGEKDRTVYINAKAQIAVSEYVKKRKDGNPYLFCGGFKAVERMREGVTHERLAYWYENPQWVTPDTHADKSVIESTIRKIQKRSGIKSRAYPHKFRRTCATFALKRGMPIEQVSKMLGHEDISTTQIYLDLNEEDLKAAHKKYVV